MITEIDTKGIVDTGRAEEQYRFLCVLETMWDWRAKTSRAGFRDAPAHFCINPDNFSGRRLYRLTREEPGCLWCTNACRELVAGPNHHGTPDPPWLLKNVERWLEIMEKKRASAKTRAVTGHGPPCVLVCGAVAQTTWRRMGRRPAGLGRVVFLPHPAARTWTSRGLARAGRLLREGRHDLLLRLEVGGRLVVTLLQEDGYAGGM